jgi:hypothetical protein
MKALRFEAMNRNIFFQLQKSEAPKGTNIKKIFNFEEVKPLF